MPSVPRLYLPKLPHPLFIPFLLVIVACSPEAPTPTKTKSDGSETLNIQVTPVQATEISNPILATGTMMPLRTTDISPMVSGLVETVYVAVGDRVKKDQPMMKIRQDEIKFQIEQLQQKVVLARAELKDARNDLDKSLNLGKTGVLSKDDSDNAKTRYEVTRARLGIAVSQLKEAELKLKDTVNRAPFDGVITARNINEGAYVQTLRAGGGGPPALQIQQIDIIVATMRIPETDLSRISLGTPVKVTVDGLGKSFDGKISAINDWIDNKSRTIDVRVGLENKDYAIKPGLFARIKIYPEPRQALIVKRAAVLGDEAPFVYINNNSKARKLEVEIAELDTDHAEVLSGLKAGQKVLIGNNLTRLHDGSMIRIKAL